MSILTSHMTVTKNPQNVKIDVNICEPHYVNLFFCLNLLNSLHV